VYHFLRMIVILPFAVAVTYCLLLNKTFRLLVLASLLCGVAAGLYTYFN